MKLQFVSFFDLVDSIPEAITQVNVQDIEAGASSFQISTLLIPRTLIGQIVCTIQPRFSIPTKLLTLNENLSILNLLEPQNMFFVSHEFELAGVYL